MIDNKAGIIITMNSIIISLTMGVLYLGNQENEGAISVGQIRFLIYFCILSMTIAVISMRPYRYMGKVFQKSTYKGTLYAQNFSKMTLEEFKADFFDVMKTGSNLYDEMLSDLYFLGRVISYKQNLVMASFIVFLVGLIGSFIIKQNFSS